MKAYYWHGEKGQKQLEDKKINNFFKGENR